MIAELLPGSGDCRVTPIDQAKMKTVGNTVSCSNKRLNLLNFTSTQRQFFVRSTVDSELSPAVGAQRVTGDPARLVGGEKYDSGADIIRLGDTFQRLYSQREVATGIAPCEVGHVGVDHTRRDGIDADAAVAQGRSEVLHERIDGTLGGGVGGQLADSRMRR